MRALLTFFAGLALWLGGLSAAYAAPEIALGARVPAAFAATDLAGKLRTLSSISGKKGVVLVFFRSARWCPFCQAQLKSLREAQAPLAQRGYTLAALSYDPVEALNAFALKQGVRYTLLSDPQSRMIDAFGLRDPAYGPGHFAEGVPKASILIIDPRGTVRWKSVATDYKIRADNAAILTAVDELH
jgi:peroxiredoxin